jgi:hypothetical protein
MYVPQACPVGKIMTIEDFWNQAFLSALTRCPAGEAKLEADVALQICIEHWQSKNLTWAPYPPLWQNQDVARIPKLNDI